MESKKITPSQKIMAKAAHFGGAWKFIILYVVIFTFWVAFNMISLVYLQVNPYLFILINLVLSGIVSMQAPIILMSQNRQEEKGKLLKENNGPADMKTEMQIKGIEQKMDLLLEGHEKTISDVHEKQFTLLKEINQKLDALKHKGF